jgi:1,4-dihydroxy-2-naphthoate octaprenyltransferase
MLFRSTLLHLRFPFSFFLMPFYLFGISQSDNLHIVGLVLSFVVMHLLFNPASNGYNSWFDKDEGPIGGLANPPKVQTALYTTSLMMHFFALIFAIYFGLDTVLFLLILTVASMAYSHPLIRIKAKPIVGVIWVAFFQGFWTYYLSLSFFEHLNIHHFSNVQHLIPAVLCSIMLLGSYPMTQIYQHEEDLKRGDITISLRLGIKGTFMWTATWFGLATAGLLYFFYLKGGFALPTLMMVLTAPTLLFFFWWWIKSNQNGEIVNHQNTMRLNWLSAIGFNLFFGYLIAKSLMHFS